MSKSKRNTVDPRHIIEAYGADTARLFMMSDSPPERDLEWTEAGVDGAWRYVQRLYRLALACNEPAQAGARGLAADDVKRLMHKTIHHVTQDIEAFHFNKAVARLRELTNALEKADNSTPDYRAAVEAVLHLFQPIIPHVCEELWAMLGHDDLLCTRPWPVADGALIVDDTVTMGVQVNGKLRATLALVRDVDAKAAEAAALADDGVQKALAGLQVKKVIVVPNRIINIVAA